MSDHKDSESELESVGSMWIGFLLIGLFVFFVSTYALRSYTALPTILAYGISIGLGLAAGYFIGTAKPVRQLLYFLMEWRPH